MSLVTVITPAFNAAPYISQMMNSVKEQTYENWELLICDDASTDATQEIVEASAATDNRIRLIDVPIHSGAAVARNLCIAEARGDYIAFLDADDLWVQTKLEKQISFMYDSGGVLSYTGYRKIDQDGSFVGKPVAVPEQVSYKMLLKAPVIACLTAMYDAKRLGKVYMPEIRKRQDFGLWLRILKAGNIALGLNECLAHYRVTPGSLSSDKLSAAKYVWQVYRDVEGLSYFESLRNLAGYAALGIRKSLNR